MHHNAITAERPECTVWKVSPPSLDYFLLFFFRMLPFSVVAGLSTMMASSSLLILPAWTFVGNFSDSISFKNSLLIESLRFSHHSFSDSV